MPTDVIMPQMGESIVEGTITKWLKKPGDRVEKDEPLFEISTDKVDAEIPSPEAGILTEIKVPEGATVGINTVVAVIGGTVARRQSLCSTQRTSSCPRWASPSSKAPSPSGSARSATTSRKIEPLFEISTDKVDAEIPSPVAGILTEIKIPEGATVEINTVVAVIGGRRRRRTAQAQPPNPRSRSPVLQPLRRADSPQPAAPSAPRLSSAASPKKTSST